ncbi:tRNA (adenosine(37)-N6)-dimethylallyltransferase MiaA [Campylobacter mucosalis]|uniref:tRNA (adenosine(37)-N6)-dimethylallyltransferase MiaA n=1 Tax=Campylobacter mucosalis TaxID=202 RepID=UPI0014704041
MRELAIIGTTASGKSAVAIELASEFNGVILSLDSLALYKHIDIASAKPSKSELWAVRHFGIDVIEPNDSFSVGAFFEIYKHSKEIAKKENKTLIITGGSGFYLKAMLSGLSPDVPKCDTPDNAQIYDLVTKIDPDFAIKVSQNDTYRLQKWFQIYKFCATKPSKWLKDNTKEPLIKSLEIYEILWDADELRERIKLRTDQMLDDGLIDEADWLFKRYGKELKPFSSIGLKECMEFFDGKISTKDELRELISTHTAQLAKRQRTFNRSQFDKTLVGSKEQILATLKSLLKG